MADSIKNIYILLAVLNAGRFENMLLSVQLAMHAYTSLITKHKGVAK